jgi:chromate reductase, NAD(P)H dehydrogenase (quinone)
MPAAPKLLFIAGSARQGALSVKLRDAARGIADAAGAETAVLDLRALALPLYDGDLEAAEGVPSGATVLRDALRQHDGLVLVTPEYNGFPTPLVVNAFDWLSRLKDGLATTADKPVALLSSSPGAAGGLRSMNFLRQYLQMAFAMLVVPQQQAVGSANQAFAADGSLADARVAAGVDKALRALMRLAAAYRTT